MTLATLVLLGLAAAAATPMVAATARRRGTDLVVLSAGLAAACLAVAALAASGVDGAAEWQRQVSHVLATVVAVSAGGVIVRAVFRLMRGEYAPRRMQTDRSAATEGVTGADGEPETVLRGGAWIGYLERAATTATLLAGFPEGIALVLAVKGLGRYAELKQSNAPEAFIIGTLTSLLWASGAAGVVWLLR